MKRCHISAGDELLRRRCCYNRAYGQPAQCHNCDFKPGTKLTRLSEVRLFFFLVFDCSDSQSIRQNLKEVLCFGFLYGQWCTFLLLRGENVAQFGDRVLAQCCFFFLIASNSESVGFLGSCIATLPRRGQPRAFHNFGFCFCSCATLPALPIFCAFDAFITFITFIAFTAFITFIAIVIVWQAVRLYARLGVYGTLEPTHLRSGTTGPKGARDPSGSYRTRRLECDCYCYCYYCCCCSYCYYYCASACHMF